MPFLGGKIGKILKKAPSILGKVATGAVQIAAGENPLSVVRERIGKDIMNSNDLTENEKEIVLAELDGELKRQSLEVKDRISARTMYKDDNKLQFWFASGFGLAYIFLTGIFIWLAWQIAIKGVEVSEFAITLISTLFGAMSAKVNTITDFLFGSSSESRDNTAKLKSMIK